MTSENTVNASGKTGKRECGIALLLGATLISVRFWTLEDPSLIAAFSSAYTGTMFALVSAGISPFLSHHFKKAT